MTSLAALPHILGAAHLGAPVAYRAPLSLTTGATGMIYALIAWPFVSFALAMIVARAIPRSDDDPIDFIPDLDTKGKY